MAPDYHVKKATLTDIGAIARHRHAMFTEMGTEFDCRELERAFVPWLRDAMQRELYHGWLAADHSGDVVGGAGVTILPWPPAPPDLGGRMAFVYNVYTEPSHRRHGLARRLMETIHGWSREQGIRRVALHASDEGRSLYESLGYTPTNEMRLIL